MVPRSLIAFLVSSSLAVAVSAGIEPPSSFGTAHAVGVPAPRPMPRGAFQLASDGRNFLALNAGDNRYGNEDVLGWRFDATGATIDPTAVPLVATPQPDSSPLAIWNGVDYAVFAVSAESVRRVRLSSSAEVTTAGDPLPWSIPSGGAWNGSRYCVALVAFDVMTLQYFDANLQATDSTSIGSTAAPVRAAAVATDGRNFLLVWETNTAQASRIYARLFDDRGRPLAPQQTLASAEAINTSPGYHGSEFSPVVSWNGSRYLVAWTGRERVEAAFVESNGVRGAAVSIPSIAMPWSRSCSVAWDGTAHLIAWSDADWKDTRGVLLSSRGDVIDTIDFQAPSYRPAVASNGELFLVIGSSDRFAVHSTGPERLARLGPSGTNYAYQGFPTITAGKASLLTAWVEAGGLYASRIARDGSVLDGSGLPIAVPANLTALDPIVSASAGDTHMIGWHSASDGIRIARVSTAGEIVDPGGAKIADSAWGGNTPVIIGSSSRRFLVARLSLDGSRQDLGIAAVESRGAVPPLTTIASDVRLGSQLHALLWTGSEYALLWRRIINDSCTGLDNCSPPYEMRLTSIDEGGAIIRDVTVPITGTFVAAATGAPYPGRELDQPANGILVATSRDDSLAFRRIGSDGAVSPEIVVPIGGAVLHGSLVPVPSGFRLLYVRTAAAPQKPWGYDARSLMLDRVGKPAGPDVALGEMLRFGQAIHALGATWITFDAPWQVFPGSPGFVVRAYFQALPDRGRAARPVR